MEIVVKEEPLPIHFGMRAVNEFIKRRGGEFQDAITSTVSLGSLDSIVSLTVVGLNEGARLASDPRRYTEDQVWDMFDEDPKLILEVSETFMESIVPLTDKLGDLSKNDNNPTEKNSKKK